MKITQIKDKEEVWQDFYNFCSRSKPYRNMQVGSNNVRKVFIRKKFDDFCNYSDIYLASNEGKIGYVFINEEERFNHVAFLFGVGGSKFTKMIKGFYKILDHINSPKYFKSEIRRSFKVDIYKRWIDKYDKRAIILSDEDQTVLWYNSDKMIGQLKVVASNEIANHLVGKTAEYNGFVFKKDTTVTSVLIDKKKYLLDIKDVEFLRDSVVINTLISNDEDFVGRVSLLFKP
jgi:hypothetical protein